MIVTGFAQKTFTDFAYAIAAPFIRNVCLVGSGDVFYKKILPALQALSHPPERIVVCDIAPPIQSQGLPYFYVPIKSGNLLPLAVLDRHGLLDSDTLWIIATPTEYHVTYAQQLARYTCRIAVEKPLAANSQQARRLQTMTRRGHEIYPINHKLFNASALECVDLCRRQPAALNPITRIEAKFYETAGFAPMRQPDDTLADIQLHLFTIVVAVFGGASSALDFTINRVEAASHNTDVRGRFQTPKTFTASRIQGQMRMNDRKIAFDFRQAKAAPHHDKFIRMYDANDHVIHEIDLNESGHEAHGRVLQALMQPTVNLRHSLTDAVLVMDLIDRARAVACEQTSYVVGELPRFLRA